MFNYRDNYKLSKSSSIVLLCFSICLLLSRNRYAYNNEQARSHGAHINMLISTYCKSKSVEDVLIHEEQKTGVLAINMAVFTKLRPYSSSNYENVHVAKANVH